MLMNVPPTLAIAVPIQTVASVPIHLAVTHVDVKPDGPVRVLAPMVVLILTNVQAIMVDAPYPAHQPLSVRTPPAVATVLVRAQPVTSVITTHPMVVLISMNVPRIMEVAARVPPVPTIREPVNANAMLVGPAVVWVPVVVLILMNVRPRMVDAVRVLIAPTPTAVARAPVRPASLVRTVKTSMSVQQTMVDVITVVVMAV